MKVNELKLFENPEFGNVRTLETEDGKVLFCGKDIATALGYAKPQNAIQAHCKGALKRGILTNGGEQSMTFIPEGDVYRLITHSKLPNAERFERWVFDEVLPTIRKHGAYMTDEALKKALTSPDFLIQLATELKTEKEKNQQLETQIEADKPKTIFADAVSVSKNSILIGDLAKLIRQNGFEIGQQRLFRWMRENNYLIKNGSSYNMPTQYSMERGWFEVKETVITHADGHTSINKTPKVTGKGQIYFINLFLNKRREREDD
jgi:phage antirepressor YoqD-like protein